MRGDLTIPNFVIHYTLDGSQPTEDSPLYEGPFKIYETTTVRAAAFERGRLIVETTSEFVRGEKAIISDPRWSEASAESDPSGGVKATPFTGPFDEQIVGEWTEADGNRRFRFSEDGVMSRIDGARIMDVAYWWYDYPNDTFENPDDPGEGGLRWANSSQETPLRLASPSAEKLFILGGGRRELTRVEEE